MRANNLAFSEWRRSGRRAPGARADLAACSVGLVFASVTPLNAWRERSSRRPLRSSGTKVFANVGGAGSFAMAWISASCSSHPGLDRRTVVLILDLVERRRLKRQRTRRIEGIRRPELRLSLIRPRRPDAQRGTRRQRDEQLASHLSCPRRLSSDCMEAPVRSTRVCRPFLLSSRTRRARARGCRRADRRRPRRCPPTCPP